MTLHSLITLASLLIAFYNIVPRARRLDLRLRLGIAAWIIAVSALLIVHYLQFYEFFASIGWTPRLGLSKWSITPQNASYLVVLGTSLIIVALARTARLSRRKIFKFRDLADELIRSSNYSELFSLLEQHLDRLLKIYEADFLMPRSKRWLEKMASELPSSEDLRRILEGKEPRKRRLGRLRRWIAPCIRSGARVLARFFPSYQSEQLAARDVFRNVLLPREFTRAVVRTRPYFAFSLFDTGTYEAHEFLDAYLREMLSDTSSVLYFEIKNNQNISSWHLYDVPESNRLLHYLFADARVAERLAVWKPIGEEMINYLDALSRNPEEDAYNYAMEDFLDRGKWESPLFVGIRFFDIMISRALYQGITWHMWLYYFTHFTKRIVRNYSPHEALPDPYAEWHTRYDYILCAIIETLTNWIRAVEDIPLDQENVVLKSVDTDYENGSIPKHSILVLVECVRHILLANAISRRLKQYIMDIVFMLYFDLRKQPGLEDYASVLVLTIKQGGLYRRRNDDAYRSQVIQCFSEHDKLKYDSSQVEEMMGFLYS
jgi:hypothetical protein